ncbi:motile sperm domain-containing protein 2-like [Epargyreus clarus]|uniref:motile sperm domain-containing protein 2-like n=1 Tax=Epargyreus clarus TaxID=520877 RepID=UPI003C3007F7
MASPADLRASFHERLKESDPDFHPLDLERIKDDRYLRRVLKHNEHSITQSTDMLFEIFAWRKWVEANDITESNIRMDYVKEGIIFPHGRDIDGCLLLIINCKKHVKGQKDFEEIKRAIIYWFDRIEREENGNKITLFFDLDNCGLTNMDMDLINYLVLLFKSYYPYFLNYIIIYQMPWVMSAAFKLIKSLLPARGVEKMKFVNNEALKEFVAPDQALACWGGQDKYVFEFVPENKENGSKKVTFAEHGEQSGELLAVSPSETIYFRTERDELTGEFKITNLDQGAVSYKIRTTAPEKFRVRPSSGTLAAGASKTIVIVVQPGFTMRTNAKDRFLVLAVRIPKADMTQKELSTLWQDSAENKVDEYRLKCYFPERERPRNPNIQEEQAEAESVNDILNLVEVKQAALEKTLGKMKLLQYFLILFTGITILISTITFLNVRQCERFCSF